MIDESRLQTLTVAKLFGAGRTLSVDKSVLNRMPVRAAAISIGLEVPPYKQKNTQRDTLLNLMVSIYRRDGVPETVKALAYAWYGRDHHANWITEFPLDRSTNGNSD